MTQKRRKVKTSVAVKTLTYSQDLYDAVVVGSGPNGLAAAVEVSAQGVAVLVLEGRETIGGGTRTAELTLPGFHHDVCSGAHPMGILSPIFVNCRSINTDSSGFSQKLQSHTL